MENYNQITNTEKHAENITAAEVEACEANMARVSILIRAILKPRSKALGKLRDYVALPDEGINAEQKADIRLAVARSLWKNADVYEVFSCMHEVSLTIKEEAETIVRVCENIRAEEGKKPSSSKAVVEEKAVEYVSDLVHGIRNRSSGFARDLKAAALLIAYRKGQTENPLELVEVDAVLNKVYAAGRRQAKKNGIDIGGKSNKPTKEAAKKAVLDILMSMIDNHEYEFEVIIGEAANK